MTTKAPLTVTASTLVAAGSTRAAPGLTGAAVDCRTIAGGVVGFRIDNGTAPGVAITLLFQISHDGANWFDYYATAGDTTTGSTNTGSFGLEVGVMYLRVLAYGNTTNGVTVESHLQAVTAV